MVAFAAVSAVYVAWQPAPLVSSRPTDPAYPAHQLTARQDLDARLWQDPFTAVTRDLDEESVRDPEDSRLGFDEPQTDKTLVLAVTLPGAPYPEVAETRRRLRYAVLSALHVAGYAPTDEKHIGHWPPNDAGSEGVEPKIQVSAFDGNWPVVTDVSAAGNVSKADLSIAIRLAGGGGAKESGPKGPAAPRNRAMGGIRQRQKTTCWSCGSTRMC